MPAPDPRALRRAFGSFMTGVTIVTTRDATGKAFGFTANSFTSVSLDPPLLLVCPGKFLSSYAAFASCRHFAVSILAEGQETVSNIFASFKGDRFAEVPHRDDARGIPLIDGACAQFSCATHQLVDAGDHALLLGRVEAFSHRELRGLGYAAGQYFSLGLERGALEPTDRQDICGAIIDLRGRVLLEETERGMRPPQIVRKGRTHLRRNLKEALVGLGLDVRLGPAYSVFDDPATHSAYILATADHLPTSGGLVAVDTVDLPNLKFTTQPIAEMMTRYATEARTGDFSLYLGDAQSGETHRLSERI